MAKAITFIPRFWLQAEDETWYPAPWWANAFPLLDAFSDASRSRAEESDRAVELCRIVAQGGMVRSTEPNADHPITDTVRAVYARAGVAHLLTHH
jgi:hypothetical protein